jgi:hypothetical protein
MKSTSRSGRDALPLASRGSRGEALESFVTKTPDKVAAPKFMKKLTERQKIGRWANNRAETHTSPFDDENGRCSGSGE